jgi:hypothetical protein
VNRLAEQLFEPGRAAAQVFLRRDRQLERLDEVAGRLVAGAPDHVALDRPVEALAVVPDDLLGDLRVERLGVEQHAVEVVDHVGDGSP